MRIDCREATALTYAALERKLSARESLRLTVHSLICGPCRVYKKQMETMRRYAARIVATDDPLPATLPQGARDRIWAKLQAADEAD